MKILSLACMFAATLAQAQPAAAPAASPSVTRLSIAAVELLPVGSRTRIQLASAVEPVVGVLRALDAAKVTLEVAGGGLVQTALVDVQSIEVWTARRRKIGKRALFGALIGSAGLAALGSASGDDSEERVYGVAYGLVFGAVGGATVGALSGVFVNTGGWTTVPLPTVQQAALAANAPGPPTPGLAASSSAPQPERLQRAVSWQVQPTFRRGAGLMLNLAW